MTPHHTMRTPTKLCPPYPCSWQPVLQSPIFTRAPPSLLWNRACWGGALWACVHAGTPLMMTGFRQLLTPSLMLLCCSIKTMYQHVNQKNGEPAPLIAEDVYQIIMQASVPLISLLCMPFPTHAHLHCSAQDPSLTAPHASCLHL